MHSSRLLNGIVLKQHNLCENNELSELAVIRYKEQEVYAFVETLMPHTTPMRQTGRQCSAVDRSIGTVRLACLNYLASPRCGRGI
jgi:hypothetical protein